MKKVSLKKALRAVLAVGLLVSSSAKADFPISGFGGSTAGSLTAIGGNIAVSTVAATTTIASGLVAGAYPRYLLVCGGIAFGGGTDQLQVQIVEAGGTQNSGGYAQLVAGLVYPAATGTPLTSILSTTGLTGIRNSVNTVGSSGGQAALQFYVYITGLTDGSRRTWYGESIYLENGGNVVTAHFEGMFTSNNTVGTGLVLATLSGSATTTDGKCNFYGVTP